MRRTAIYTPGGGNKRTVAARVFFEEFVRPLKTGEQACHSCDNGPCIRPSHLFAGTQRENIQDAIQKGRFYQHRLRDREYARGRNHWRVKRRLAIIAKKRHDKTNTSSL